MTPNKMLDEVLDFIYNTPVQMEFNASQFQAATIRLSLNKYVSPNHLDGSSSDELIGILELKEILEKLSKDGYLKQDEEFKVLFSTTFEGRWFIQQGGYSNAYEMETWRTRIQNLKDWLLIVFSFLAGFGAIGLVIVELLKHYVWKRP